MKPQVLRHVFGTSSATTNDVAHIDFPSAGYILGIEWSATSTTYTAGDRVEMELSVSSTCQFTTNDCLGVISNAVYGGGVVTSGGPSPINKFVGPLALYLPAGTRVYLHTIQAGTNATRIGSNILFQPI